MTDPVWFNGDWYWTDTVDGRPFSPKKDSKMASVTTKTFEFFEVDVSEDEVKKAVIAAVRDRLTPQQKVDESIAPSVKKTQYGGFTVYLKKDTSGGS